MRFIPYYILIFVLSLVPFIGIFFTSLLPHTHDGFVHLARIGAYFKALQDWQIPVRWAGDLNYGYGLPLFNFIYHVPYLIASIIIFLGFGLVSAFKITLVLSFILSGIFMFGFCLEFFKDIKKTILVTLFYQFTPFRLVEILVRGSFGEVYAYAFFPLVLWGIVLLFKKINYWNIFLTSTGTALLVLSHNAVSLLFFLTCILFIIFFARKFKDYIFALLSLFLGLLLTSFYWIPAIFEHRYTYGDLFMKTLYTSHFPPLLNFFVPNFLNDPKLQTGGISIQFGLFHTIALMLGVFALFTYRKISTVDRRIIIFCIIVFLISLFIMQPISKPIWENISILRQFQFSWRMLSIVGFAMSLASISFFYFSLFKKNIIYVSLLFLVVFSTVYYWRPLLGRDSIDENYYWNYPLTSTYFGETDLIWSKGPYGKYPVNRVDVIDGKGSIGTIVKKSNLLHFSVNAQTPIKIVSHIQYFPGWRAYVDGKQVRIEFQYQIYRGEIVFSVPKGRHEIKLTFGESRIRFLADIISIVAFGSLLTFGLTRNFHEA